MIINKKTRQQRTYLLYFFFFIRPQVIRASLFDRFIHIEFRRKKARMISMLADDKNRVGEKKRKTSDELLKRRAAIQLLSVRDNHLSIGCRRRRVRKRNPKWEKFPRNRRIRQTRFSVNTDRRADEREHDALRMSI